MGAASPKAGLAEGGCAPTSLVLRVPTSPWVHMGGKELRDPQLELVLLHQIISPWRGGWGGLPGENSPPFLLEMVGTHDQDAICKSMRFARFPVPSQPGGKKRHPTHTRALISTAGRQIPSLGANVVGGGGWEGTAGTAEAKRGERRAGGSACQLLCPLGTEGACLLSPPAGRWAFSPPSQDKSKPPP